MEDREIVLITGGNSGLGFSTITLLLKSRTPYRIIMGARSPSKAASALKELEALEGRNEASAIESLQLDIEDDESIMKALEVVTDKYSRLDVLINNAGATFDHMILRGQMTPRQSWNKCWDVNVTGTHLLTMRFAGLLVKGKAPRLVFIASGLTSLTQTCDAGAHHHAFVNEPLPAGWPKDVAKIGSVSYRAAKTGLNMVMREWCRILKNDGVRVFSISPGGMLTNFGDDRQALARYNAKDPIIAADMVRAVVEGERDEDAGRIRHGDSIMPW